MLETNCFLFHDMIFNSRWIVGSSRPSMRWFLWLIDGSLIFVAICGVEDDNQLVDCGVASNFDAIGRSIF